MVSSLQGQLCISRLTVPVQPGNRLVIKHAVILAGNEAQIAGRPCLPASKLRRLNCANGKNLPNFVAGAPEPQGLCWTAGSLRRVAMQVNQRGLGMPGNPAGAGRSGHMTRCQVARYDLLDGLALTSLTRRVSLQGSGFRIGGCPVGSQASGFLAKSRPVSAWSGFGVQRQLSAQSSEKAMDKTHTGGSSSGTFLSFSAGNPAQSRVPLGRARSTFSDSQAQRLSETGDVPRNGNGNALEAVAKPEGSEADSWQPGNEPQLGGRSAEYLGSVRIERREGGREPLGGYVRHHNSGDVARDDVAGRSDVGNVEDGVDRDAGPTAGVASALEDERAMERESRGRNLEGAERGRPAERGRAEAESDESKFGQAPESSLDEDREQTGHQVSSSQESRVQGSDAPSVSTRVQGPDRQGSPKEQVFSQEGSGAGSSRNVGAGEEEQEEEEEERFLSRDEVRSGGEGAAKPIDPHRVFVGNLPWEISSPELCREVGALFSQYGTVEDVEMATYPKQTQASLQRGKHRGFGFVRMSTPEEAQRVISLLHQRPFRGIPLQVNRAVVKAGPYPPRDPSQKAARGPLAPRPGRSHTKLFVGGLHRDTDAEDLKEIFSQYGKVVDAKVVRTRVTRQSMGFGFVTLSNEESALKAVENRDGSMINGNIVKVNIAQFYKLRS